MNMLKMLKSLELKKLKSLELKMLKSLELKKLKKSFAHGVVFGHGVGFSIKFEVEEM